MGYSTKKKRGRPKVERSAHDYGNAYVQARADRFRPFGGDSSKGHEFTCAGRLMLVGAFDGMEQEPAAYLSALLEYSNGYWGNYGGGAKIAVYERQDRSHDTRWEDPHGEWFNALDAQLRDAGHQARSAVHAVSVDRHWFPDEDVSWAARIINRRFRDKGLSVCGELACDSDFAMLELLRAGVRALVGQRLIRRAA
jgi:hypothetical protein